MVSLLPVLADNLAEGLQKGKCEDSNRTCSSQQQQILSNVAEKCLAI